MRLFLFDGKEHTVYKDQPYDYLVVESKAEKKFDVVPHGRLTFTKDGCFVQSDSKTVKIV